MKNVCVPKFADIAKYVSRAEVRSECCSHAMYGVSHRTRGRRISRRTYRHRGRRFLSATYRRQQILHIALKRPTVVETSQSRIRWIFLLVHRVRSIESFVSGTGSKIEAQACPITIHSSISSSQFDARGEKRDRFTKDRRASVRRS